MMSLYGHAHIDRDALKRWTSALSTEKIDVVDVGGQSIYLDETTKNILEDQAHSFSKLIADLPPDGDWRECEGVLHLLMKTRQTEAITKSRVRQSVVLE